TCDPQGRLLSCLAELTPTTAALALLADGPTRLTKLGHLRGHETDRLTALYTEAENIGALVREGEDFLDFTGNYPLQAATLDSYPDHRMANFVAILGLLVEGIDVTDMATTAKTMPDFPAAWRQLASLERQIRA